MANSITQKVSKRSWTKYYSYALEVLSKLNDDHEFIFQGRIVKTKLLSQLAANAAIKELNSDYTTGGPQKALKESKTQIAAYNGNPLFVRDIAKSTKRIPLGYAAEVIMQCAIAALFINRGKQSITSDLVEKELMRFLNMEGSEWNNNKNSVAINRKIIKSGIPNLNSNQKDTVVSCISCSEQVFHYFLNKKEEGNILSDKTLKPFFDDACRYVNSTAPRAHAHYFYTNKKSDIILIKSLSVSGQGKVKRDIETYYFTNFGKGNINPEWKKQKIKLEISMKIRGETQFGQVSGIKQQNLKNLAESLGVSLSKKTMDFIKENVDDHEGDENALIAKSRDVYSKFYSDMTSELNDTDASLFLQNIKKFLAAPNEKDLVIVDIGKGLKTYTVKSIDELIDNWKITAERHEVKAKVTTATSKSTIFKVWLDDENKDENHLVSIESKFTGGVFRNQIKSGRQLRKWMAFQEANNS